jgi:hypothetical protein
MIPTYTVKVALAARKYLTPAAKVDVLAALPNLTPSHAKTHDPVVQVVAAKIWDVLTECRVGSSKVRIGEDGDADATDLSGLCEAFGGGGHEEIERKKTTEDNSGLREGGSAVGQTSSLGRIGP